MIERLESSQPWPDVIDVQYQRAYARASAQIDGGEALCLVDRELGIAHPVISRSVDLPGASATDLITPYGYGGPAAIAPSPIRPDAVAASEFESRLSEWARANEVICEFRRQHPSAVQSQTLHPLDDRDRDLVAIDLTDGYEAAFALAAGRHRTAVRKAQRSGVSVRLGDYRTLTDQQSPFRLIYGEAMERLHSADRYRVDDGYFQALLGLRHDDIALTEAVVDGQVVAAAIFLMHRGADDAFYHLSASTDLGNGVAATNLLLDAGSQIAAESGARRLILGGGLRAGDGLEKFKSSVGSLRLPFLVRRTVYCHELYEAAVALHHSSATGGPSDFFPAYRAPKGVS